MPSDFFAAIVAVPMTVGVAILLCARILIRKTPGVVTWRNILHGYLGVMLALMAYAAVETTITGFDKVVRGDITDAELYSWVPQWTLYLFFFVGPFLLLLATVIGLPLFLVLRRLGFASVIGVMLIPVLYSIGWSIYFRVTNAWWCNIHTQSCASDAFLSALVPSLLIALGFAATAGLPFLRTPRDACAAVNA